MHPVSIRAQKVPWLTAAVLACLGGPAGASGRILLTNRPRKTIRSSRRKHPRGKMRLVRARQGRWRHFRRRHIPGRLYAGVLPGAADKPPGPLPPPGRCWLTWPGFQLIEGGSRVFFQLNKQVPQAIEARKRGFDILFPGCRIRIKNNMHRLVTAYFPSTPVFDIRTLNTKRGVVARIRLKTSVNPRIHWIVKHGWAYLFVDFGPYGQGRAAKHITATRPRRPTAANPAPSDR